MACINVTGYTVSFTVETKFGDRLEAAMDRYIAERDGIDRDHAVHHELEEELWSNLREAFAYSELQAELSSSMLYGSLTFTVEVLDPDVSDVLCLCERVVQDWANDLGIEQWRDL